MGLKEQFIKIEPGTALVSEYFETSKGIADELAWIDSHVLNDNITVYILNGLGTDEAAPKRGENSATNIAMTTNNIGFKRNGNQSQQGQMYNNTNFSSFSGCNGNNLNTYKIPRATQ
ncbi:unnamed protein product [Fraxinus pennsylvanica]|uniref:Uncharacterized protein n=1 Tax=Fraxinus pennsylvanica TaxID=56036 RepID=A0AAD1ZV23_9LAMI|nr:unnamed protein product [Fraxinus pennsylvanica]